MNSQILETRILGRLATQRFFAKYRKKLHNLRRIVAGDLSPLNATSEQRADQQSDNPANSQNRSLDELYDIDIQDFYEGRSNHVLRALKTLVMQTAFKQPEIEILGLESESALLHQLYLTKRLGPRPEGCDAAHHMRLALWDALIGGVGWAGITFERGMPAITWFDCLDLTWDTAARNIGDIQWVSIRCRRPLRQWVESFGQKFFAEEARDVKNLDRSFELEFYYDTEGERGHHAVLAPSANDSLKVIHLGPNPFSFSAAHGRLPFLPVEPVYFFQTPSVRYPIGLASLVLPHQIALWEAERRIRDTLRLGKPTILLNESAIKPEDRKRIGDGRTVPDVLAVQAGADLNQAFAISPVPQISATLTAYIAMNERMLTAMAGDNPYASGAPVDGVRYASEVAAINGHSGITASTVAKDHAAHWANILRKYLAACAMYDRAPITLHYEDVLLKFDAKDPVGPYIRDDCTLTVREDTLRYEPPEMALSRARAVLRDALQIASPDSDIVKRAFAGVLRAQRIPDAHQWIAPSSEV